MSAVHFICLYLVYSFFTSTDETVAKHSINPVPIDALHMHSPTAGTWLAVVDLHDGDAS